MRPAWLLSLLVYVLVLVGLFTRQGALLALALPLLAYMAVGLLEQPELPRLTVERTLSLDRVDAGTPATVHLVVSNASGRPATLLIEDRIPPGLQVIEGDTRALTMLEPGAVAEVTYVVRGRRGVYRFAELGATTYDPLGLVSRSAAIAAPGILFVMPTVLRLRRLALRPRRTQVYTGSAPARLGGPGVDFFGIRAYQPGDPMRYLNARATARHTEALFVNEFEQERVTEVGIILDVRSRSNIDTAEGSLLEYGIQAAAALAAGLLDQGNRVGLLQYGSVLDWTFPGYGKIQRERILRALARAEPGDAPAFEELANFPTQLFPARMQLILISPLLPTDRDMLVRLRARGYQLLVICPDPIGFERRALDDTLAAGLAARAARLQRGELLTELMRAGIGVVDWDVVQPLQQVAERLSRAPFWADLGGGMR